MSVGPDDQPVSPADELVDQMREATERLRDQAWKVALPSSPLTEQPDPADDHETGE